MSRNTSRVAVSLPSLRHLQGRLIYVIIPILIPIIICASMLQSEWEVSPYNEGRRRSSQLSVSSRDSATGRLRQIVSNLVPDVTEEEYSHEDQRCGRLLPGVHGYSRTMHAHTKWQMESFSMSSIPSYQRTMHAFTLNQFNHQRSLSQTRSETSSPHIEAQQAMLPSPVCADLTIDEAPVPPCNSPSAEQQVARIGTKKPRRDTEPVLRDFAAARKIRYSIARE